jgi:ribonuclease T1
VDRWIRILLLLALAVGAVHWWQERSDGGPPSTAGSPAAVSSGNDSSPASGEASRFPSFLPPEAIATIELIERGGPFPYDRDGSIFQNRERQLPARTRGYYREFTVRTPGSRDRGARRIVSGGDPPEVYYYTDDHYRTFRRVEVPP